jgi:hypothetical protein
LKDTPKESYSSTTELTLPEEDEVNEELYE